MPSTGLRVDKLLWHLRLTKSRSLAQQIAETGHMRLNGRRVERSSAHVRVGDRLVVPLEAGVRVIELVRLPSRRGPASEAQGCYRVLDVAPVSP